MRKRRDISYDEDVIREVYGQLGGQYPVEMIRGILDASVNYTHQMIRYSDKLAVPIPRMGWLTANEGRIERMRKFLRLRADRARRGSAADEYLRDELKAMDIKLRKLSQISAMGESKLHPFLVPDPKRYGWHLFAGDRDGIERRQEGILDSKFKI
jgi:hypothetical protein